MKMVIGKLRTSLDENSRVIRLGDRVAEVELSGFYFEIRTTDETRTAIVKEGRKVVFEATVGVPDVDLEYFWSTEVGKGVGPYVIRMEARQRQVMVTVKRYRPVEVGETIAYIEVVGKV